MPPGPALLDLAFTYDTDTKRVTFSANSGNFLFLLDSLDDVLASSYKLQLATTDAPEQDMPANALSITASEGAGIESLSMSLAAETTAAALAQRFGFSWPMGESIVLKNPAVSYQKSPLYLKFVLLLDIPAAQAQDLVTVMEVTAGPTLSLKVYIAGIHGWHDHAIRAVSQLYST